MPPAINFPVIRNRAKSKDLESGVMELQHLEVDEQLEQLDRRKLETLANLNPYLSENETLLLSYYKRVKITWSNSAIKNLQRSTGLKLTNSLNRCKFALEAAKLELHFHHSDQ